jgi:hypothetical protein
MARILAVALQPSNGVVPPRALLLPLALAPVDGITAIYNFGDSISDTGNHIGEQPAGLLEYYNHPILTTYIFLHVPLQQDIYYVKSREL